MRAPIITIVSLSSALFAMLPAAHADGGTDDPFEMCTTLSGTCEIDGNWRLTASTYDFEDREVILKASGSLTAAHEAEIDEWGAVIIGSRTLRLQAPGFHTEDDSVITNSGESSGWPHLIIEVDGDATFSGNLSWPMPPEATVEPMQLSIGATGDLLITSSARIFAKQAGGEGGHLFLWANGNLKSAGLVSVTAQNGGRIDAFADGILKIEGAAIWTADTNITASVFNGQAGDIVLRSGDKMTIDGDLSASGFDDGGRLSGGRIHLTSGAGIDIEGRIHAIGTTSPPGGENGRGGSIRIDSRGDLNVKDGAEIHAHGSSRGSSPGAYGGRIMLNSAADLYIDGDLASYGCHGSTVVDALAMGDIEIEANIYNFNSCDTATNIIQFESRSGKLSAEGALNATNAVGGGISKITMESCETRIERASEEYGLLTRGATAVNTIVGREKISLDALVQASAADGNAENRLWTSAGGGEDIDWNTDSEPNPFPEYDFSILDPDRLCDCPVEDCFRYYGDADGDGQISRRLGGPDCDDSNPVIKWDLDVAEEVLGDGIDENCDCPPRPLPREGETVNDDCSDDPWRPPGSPEGDTGGADPGSDTGPVTSGADTGVVPVEAQESTVLKATAGSRRCGCTAASSRSIIAWLLPLALLARRRRT